MKGGRGDGSIPRKRGITFEDTKKEEELLKYQTLDENDSLDPSFSDFIMPYSAICRQRYILSGRKYRKQFISEIVHQETMQIRALDGVRIRRQFCNPIIEPMEVLDDISITEKERIRIEKLVHNISY